MVNLFFAVNKNLFNFIDIKSDFIYFFFDSVVLFSKYVIIEFFSIFSISIHKINIRVNQSICRYEFILMQTEHLLISYRLLARWQHFIYWILRLAKFNTKKVGGILPPRKISRKCWNIEFLTFDVLIFFVCHI